MLLGKDPGPAAVAEWTAETGTGAARPRVLVAGTSHTIEAVADAVGDAGEILPARSIEEALLHLQGQVGIVVCDVRFDDSRMFDFLQKLKDRPQAPGCRIVCVRPSGTRLSPNMRKAIAQALEALGVEVFVDLHQLALDSGKDAARETLREVVLVGRPGFEPGTKGL